MRTLFGMVLARSVAETGSPDRGFEWLRRLDAQTKEYVQNPALLIEKLNRGEGLVTVWELTDMLWQQKRGLPLGYHFPSSGTPVIDDSIGLVKGAQHPRRRAGVHRLAWGASRPSSSRPATPSACRRAPTCRPSALPALGAGGAARPGAGPVDWALIAKNGQEWMARWDRKVRGKGFQAAERRAPAALRPLQPLQELSAHALPIAPRPARQELRRTSACWRELSLAVERGRDPRPAGAVAAAARPPRCACSPASRRPDGGRHPGRGRGRHPRCRRRAAASAWSSSTTPSSRT